MFTPYTCITCRVAFRDMDLQRDHYKCEWHRYNLKRKVADLPPIKFDDFDEKIARLRESEKRENQDKAETYLCRTCRKTFGSKNQYDNHLVSKKHREKAHNVSDPAIEDVPMAEPVVVQNESQNKAQPLQGDDDMEIDSDVESVDTDEWIEDTENPVRNNDCLFCDHHSRSWVRNLRHMTVEHSFFIPDVEYCTDVRGLLIYLGEKVFGGYMCLWCNERGKGFRSAEAARTHMIDKGHCKMKHEAETLAEFEEFYDYSSSYPDAESADPDQEVDDIPELIPDNKECQLVLPSGNTLGHRSLFRYYKQYLNPKKAICKRQKLHKVLGIYRALGWSESNSETIKQKVKDLKYMHRIQAKYSVDLNIKANKLQTHFRPQVNF